MLQRELGCQPGAFGGEALLVPLYCLPVCVDAKHHKLGQFRLSVLSLSSRRIPLLGSSRPFLFDVTLYFFEQRRHPIQSTNKCPILRHNHFSSQHRSGRSHDSLLCTRVRLECACAQSREATTRDVLLFFLYCYFCFSQSFSDQVRLLVMKRRVRIQPFFHRLEAIVSCLHTPYSSFFFLQGISTPYSFPTLAKNVLLHLSQKRGAFC